MTYRILALDLDGTLLDPGGALRPAVAAAVTRARDGGLQVVVCTGRRYRTTRPFLRQLGLEGPTVIQNGVVVKDAASGATLGHDYLSAEAYHAALPLMRAVCPPLVYVDHDGGTVDFWTEPADRAHPFQAEYVDDNAQAAGVVESLGTPPSEALVMMSCLADAASLEELRDSITTTLSGGVRTNFLTNKNYSGHILEVVSASSGKWVALSGVAARLGVAPEEIAVIGDDHNDVEMIAHAGLGIAMGNAVDAAKEAADEVAESNDEDGAARAIERWVLRVGG